MLVTVGWAWQTRPSLRLPAGRRHGLALTVGVSICALVGTVVAPAAMTGPTPRICQGSSWLCDARYDEIAQLAAHNAMATTADRFIGPLQDPDIVGQLNAGVRALLIDTHRWERPEEVAERLATSEFSPELRQQLTRVLTRVNPPRPGTWLCHSVCGAGALELEPTLRQIGDWLRTHTTEVVTLIVQDGISPQQTRNAFEQAGLADLLYEPDPDPNRPWPTMENMIDSGRRLVVFAEKADGPPPWYRNFYRYGMETPYAFRSPGEMTCTPNRGGTDKRLFLLNHFVTADGGRRLDAAAVNSRRQVLYRAHTCERQRGRPVNFVAVDYATLGDARSAVDTLNAERFQGDDKGSPRSGIKDLHRSASKSGRRRS
ncbi:PI-PLC domain-containing protein [Streptomyces sp. NPDC057438]|uniref:PI-PLC domain-containing protein n=1 Tax=Streptomyces sp. NPDC057438 TaxID=3346133 RepID=UPI0036BAD214